MVETTFSTLMHQPMIMSDDDSSTSHAGFITDQGTIKESLEILHLPFCYKYGSGQTDKKIIDKDARLPKRNNTN